MGKEGGGDNVERLNRRGFLRMAGAAGAAFAGGLSANLIKPPYGSSSPPDVGASTLEEASAAENTRLTQEIQRKIIGIPGVTNVSIIDDDNSPHHNAIYKDVYNRLIELLPEKKRKEFPKPVAVAFDSTESDAWNINRSLREKGLIALTSTAYDSSDDKLAYLFGHELGHALYKYDAKLAEELGGLNNPAVQPLLEKIRQRVDKLFKDPNEAAIVYGNLRGELMADGISVRISGETAPAIAWLKASTEHNESTSANDFIGNYTLPAHSKEEIRRDLIAIQERIQAEGMMDHPNNAERTQYVEMLSRSPAFLASRGM